MFSLHLYESSCPTPPRSNPRAELQLPAPATLTRLVKFRRGLLLPRKCLNPREGNDRCGQRGPVKAQPWG